ncbi:MAG: outer membrane lipoprotein carrier protein LolA [Nitrospirae bacterium YQR-1]
MFKTFSLIFICVSLLCNIAEAAEFTENNQKLLEDLKSNLGKVESLEAAFTQTRYLSLFEERLTSKGRLYFQAPNMMRWEITEPYKSILIFSQGAASKYEVTEGKTRKMKLAGSEFFAQVMEQMMKFIKGDFTSLNKTYNLEVKKDKEIRVMLAPYSSGKPSKLSSFTFHINPANYRVTRLIITEQSEDNKNTGDRIEIDFKTESENKKLPDEIFSQTNPKLF